MANDIDISEIRKLTNFIKDNYTYDFSNYALSSFKRRLQRLFEIHKVSDVTSLLSKIGSLDFEKQFLSELTVNVTEMFRDPQMWRILGEQIIPKILEQRNSVRVWHAGCSSGEEIVSLIILFNEFKLQGKLEIVASDIDNTILSKAQKANFSKKSMEINYSNFKDVFNEDTSWDKYFSFDENQALFNQDYLKHVEFLKHDLVLGNKINDFDIILCRNVLIYFNQNLQNKVLQLFDESLDRGGYLIIGSKESLMWSDANTKFKEIDSEEKIYQKMRY